MKTAANSAEHRPGPAAHVDLATLVSKVPCGLALALLAQAIFVGIISFTVPPSGISGWGLLLLVASSCGISVVSHVAGQRNIKRSFQETERFVGQIRRSRQAMAEAPRTGQIECDAIIDHVTSISAQINRHVLAKESLSRMLDDLERVVADSGTGIWWWKPNTNHFSANKHAQQTLGYTEGDFPLRTWASWTSAIHSEDRHAVTTAIHHALKNKSNVDLEARILTCDETYRWYRIRAFVDRLDTEENRRVVGVIEDITLSRLVNQEITGVADIVGQIDIAIAVINEEMKVAWCNQYFGSLCPDGWENAKGQRYDAILDQVAAGNDNYAQLIEDIQQQRKAQHMLSTQAKSNEIRWLDVHTLPRLNPTTSESETILYFTDITESEKQLALERSDREAAQAQARDTVAFMANMSHEIRTPLTAILGFADIMADADSLAECQEAGRTIQRNGDHLLSVINNVLDLSKIQSNSLEIEPVPTDIRSLLKELSDLVGVKAKAKGLDLQIFTPNEVPQRVILDPARVRQILLNLVDNAIKFTDSGSATVRVSLETDQTRGDQLSIEVADTGKGVPESVRQGFMASHEQPSDENVKPYGGVGLGLSICRRLAEAMEGMLSLESDPTGGSTFTLSLPLLIADEETVDPSSQEQDSVPDKTSRFTGKRILLVEDGIDNQRLIAHLLTKSGAKVTIAQDGQEALELLPSSPPEDPMAEPPFDMVLMDMQMPIVDGYTATEELRRREFRGPIVALTASVLPEDRLRCLESGCTDFLAKPLSRKAFDKVLSTWLDDEADNIPQPHIAGRSSDQQDARDHHATNRRQ